MNDKNETLVTEVTIRDLKELGHQGGATAYLLDGTEMILSKNYGLIRKAGVVAGEVQTVEVIAQYVSVYAQIRTIKRNGILIARRINQGNKSVLLLTGKGYRRKSKKL